MKCLSESVHKFKEPERVIGDIDNMVFRPFTANPIGNLFRHIQNFISIHLISELPNGKDIRREFPMDNHENEEKYILSQKEQNDKCQIMNLYDDAENSIKTFSDFIKEFTEKYKIDAYITNWEEDPDFKKLVVYLLSDRDQLVRYEYERKEIYDKPYSHNLSLIYPIFDSRGRTIKIKDSKCFLDRTEESVYDFTSSFFYHHFDLDATQYFDEAKEKFYEIIDKSNYGPNKKVAGFDVLKDIKDIENTYLWFRKLVEKIRSEFDLFKIKEEFGSEYGNQLMYRISTDDYCIKIHYPDWIDDYMLMIEIHGRFANDTSFEYTDFCKGYEILSINKFKDYCEERFPMVKIKEWNE